MLPVLGKLRRGVVSAIIFIWRWAFVFELIAVQPRHALLDADASLLLVEDAFDRSK